MNNSFSEVCSMRGEHLLGELKNNTHKDYVDLKKKFIE